MRTLFDHLLEYVDHNDREAVEIVYGIQQITISDNYSIQDIMVLIENVLAERKREKQELQKVKAENIFEVEETKKSFWEILKNLFQRKKYQDEEELEHHTDMEMTEAESIQADFEDATVFLATSGNTYFITLKSNNLEKPITIKPNIFPCIFGKSRKSSDYIIDSPVISRVHMKLSADDNGFYIEDLNSTNGTFLNQIKLAPHIPTEIKEGDMISIANIDFSVE
jgi:pSer/pThr/pTyr-binding forkhead associated (FHA) protein